MTRLTDTIFDTPTITVGDVLRVFDNQDDGLDAKKHLRVVLAIVGDELTSVAICSDDGTSTRTCVIMPGELGERLPPKRSYVSYDEATTRSLKSLIDNYHKVSTGGVTCPQPLLKRIKDGTRRDPRARPWLRKLIHGVPAGARILRC